MLSLFLLKMQNRRGRTLTRDGAFGGKEVKSQRMVLMGLLRAELLFEYIVLAYFQKIGLNAIDAAATVEIY